jgi:hypothetical protein
MIWNGITKVVYVENMGNSPAAIQPGTGTLFINIDRFNEFSPEMWEWLLEHESAHAEFNTGNEFFVDRIAFIRQCFKGRSMKHIISESRKFLHYDSKMNRRRVETMLALGNLITKRLRAYELDYNLPQNRKKGMKNYRDDLIIQFSDCIKRGDGNAAIAVAKELRTLTTNENDLKVVDGALKELYDKRNGILNAGVKGFFNKIKEAGEAKKAKKEEKEAQKTEKAEQRQKNVEDRNERKNKALEAKIKLKEAKAKAIEEGKLPQGGGAGNVKEIIGGVLKGAGAVAGVALGNESLSNAGNFLGDAIAGKKEEPENKAPESNTNTNNDTPPAEKPKGLSTWAIVGIVAGGLVVVGGIIWAIVHFSRKKE